MDLDTLLYLVLAVVSAQCVMDASRSRFEEVSSILALSAEPTPKSAVTPGPDDVLRLKTLLTDQRDTWVRPDLDATVVNVSLGIRHISLSELQSTITVSAVVKMEWVDARSQSVWQNSSTEAIRAIKMMHISSDNIWHPDIVLKNGLAGRGSGLLDGSLATLYPDGRVLWTPSAVLEAYCSLDLRRWPFERHQCDLHLGSWTLDVSQLQIGAIGHKHEFPGQTAGEFVVDWVGEERQVAVEPEIGTPFETVIYTFALHREPGTYHAVIFTPAAVVIILCLATFLLPPQAGEKVLLGGVNAMLICLFLIYFAHSLPVLTNQTPLIVVFYSASLYLVCLSLVSAVLVLNLSRQRHCSGLPRGLKQVLTGSVGRVLQLSGYIERVMGVDLGPCSNRPSVAQEELPVVYHDEMVTSAHTTSMVNLIPSEGQNSENSSRPQDHNKEWLLLAAAIDRVLFIIYSVVFIVLAIAFQV